jgi:tetratricopeptide (TPR) repeat protein
MPFRAAICPTCHGPLQVPEDKDIVKCMYCGVDVVVREAIQLVPGNSKNLFQLAEQAFAAENYQEAYDYYTKVLEIEPKNVAAWFGKGAAAGWLSNLTQFRFAEMQVDFNNAIEFTPDPEKQSMREQCGLRMNDVAMACHSVSRKHVDQFVSVPSSWPEYIGRCDQIIAALTVANSLAPKNALIAKNIIVICNDNIAGMMFMDAGGQTVRLFLTPAGEQARRQTIATYAEKAMALDPDYVVPQVRSAKPSTCFVVTATMGNDQHPSVQTLRAFRDESLVRSRAGRIFISWYEVRGPRLAMLIEKSRFARTMSHLLVVAPSVAIVRLLNLMTRSTPAAQERTRT